VRIDSVTADNRRKAFLVRFDGRHYWMPYARLPVTPSPENRVVSVGPEPEIGNEGFTYLLADGSEDTIHLDAVLDYNRDPAFMNDLLLYRLTVQALEALEESPVGVRELSRRLGTSATQVYRLLDTTNKRKSVGQMVALLHLLGREVDLVVKRREVG
jgi:hypothetical protein